MIDLFHLRFPLSILYFIVKLITHTFFVRYKYENNTVLDISSPDTSSPLNYQLYGNGKIGVDAPSRGTQNQLLERQVLLFSRSTNRIANMSSTLCKVKLTFLQLFSSIWYLELNILLICIVKFTCSFPFKAIIVSNVNVVKGLFEPNCCPLIWMDTSWVVFLGLTFLAFLSLLMLLIIAQPLPLLVS